MNVRGGYGMDYQIKVCSSMCETETFTVSGIEGNHRDFGEKFDHDPESAEEYGCGDMRFSPIPPAADVLFKYGIDELEYWTIANSLAERLSFGSCGHCE